MILKSKHLQGRIPEENVEISQTLIIFITSQSAPHPE
jgi:hypothetical protein